MPRLLSVYAAGLISAVGIFVGSAVFPSVSDEVAVAFSGEATGAVVAVGAVEASDVSVVFGVPVASGVALGFAFSRDAFTASSSTREVYLVSAEYVT